VLLICALTFSLGKLTAARLELERHAPASQHSPAGTSTPVWLEVLDGFMVLVVGSMPAALFLYSRRKGYQQDWTLDRFKAEMILHWKFQQILDGEYTEGLPAQPTGVAYAQSPWNKGWRQKTEKSYAKPPRLGFHQPPRAEW
jgi:hypothetical protein